MPKIATASILFAAVAFALCPESAHAQHRGGAAHAGYHGGYHGGYYHGGYGWYRPYGYYPYGWYRPYYPFIGIGIGLYVPYYGSYAYPLPPGVVYADPTPAVVANTPPPDGAAPASPPGQPQVERPPQDNAGHLRLLVPENSEVLINGAKIAQTGAQREVVTPALQSGQRYSYKISVRYSDPQGKPVDDTREIRFQANDWFVIDFTRPAPPMAQPAFEPPAPTPVK
jgi:uncharacterized protein (TIGR03000 family)